MPDPQLDPEVDQSNPGNVVNYNTAVSFEATYFTLMQQGNGEENTIQKVNAAIQLFWISGAHTHASTLAAAAIAQGEAIGIAVDLQQLLVTSIPRVIASLAAAAQPPVPVAGDSPGTDGAAAIAVASAAVDQAAVALEQAKNALTQAAVNMTALGGG